MSDTSYHDECDVLRELRTSGRLFELLEESEGSELRLQKRLRQEYPDELVRAALTLAELRKKGESKFSRAAGMWFDRKGLEQATSEAVSRYKAERFSGLVWDYCCGVGGDAIALAERCEVTAVDLNPAACLRTEWNAEVYGLGESVQTKCADVETLAAREGLLHIDPDRRPGSGGRVVRVEDCVPGLETLSRFTREFSGGAIKLSPAGNFANKFAGVETELISLHGECKEATIWFGELVRKEEWRATVLPAGESIAGDPLEVYPEIGALERYLYDPDPAVVRAGLVDLLSHRLLIKRLDDAEEYLTSDEFVCSPFVRGFEVLANLPNNEKAIRRYFRESNFGRVEIKCRHLPIQVESIRRKLPLPGDDPSVLVFARVGGKARAVVCRRCD